MERNRNKNHLKAVEDEPIADVIYMTDIVKDSMNKRRKSLSPEQKEYFLDNGSYWEGMETMLKDQIDFLQSQLDYAHAQRAYALQMVGMLPEHGGFPE